MSALARAVETAARFRAAVEAADVEAFIGTLAPDAVLKSPISMRTEFRGHEEMRELMPAVFATISELRYFEDVGDATTRALFYRARAGRQPLEEATLLRLDAEARVHEMTLFFRPLPGLAAVTAGLGPRLVRPRSVARARAVAAMTRPLAALTDVGDRLAVRLVRR